MRFLDQLKGGDLRTLGQSNEIVHSVIDPESFDDLFKAINYPDRVVAMRCIDVIEKISREHPEYLQPHKAELITLLHQSSPKEFKWHLPLLIVRLDLSDGETGEVWATLTNWALDRTESRIVRVNSIQGLHDLLMIHPELQLDFIQTIEELDRENIPSIKARIRKLKSAGFQKDS